MKCGSNECTNEAEHAYVWTDDWKVCCSECRAKILGLARFMSHGTPMATMQPLPVFLATFGEGPLKAASKEATADA